jgi:hyperosmotically inducible protein
MLRQVIVAFAVVALGTLSVPAVRAAEQPSQDPYATEKKESTVDKVERATNNAAEKGKEAANKAAKELSDSWITLKTKLNLFADDRVSSTDVHVTTKQRVVALTGKVGSEAARKAAEEDVRKVDGVKGVENHLVVSKTAPKAVERKDEEIVKDVEGRIKKDPGLKTADIEVHADNGIVTLTGKAPSLRTSTHASEVASRVSGVRAVHNELSIEEQHG